MPAPATQAEMRTVRNGARGVPPGTPLPTPGSRPHLSGTDNLERLNYFAPKFCVAEALLVFVVPLPNKPKHFRASALSFGIHLSFV